MCGTRAAAGTVRGMDLDLTAGATDAWRDLTGVVVVSVAGADYVLAPETAPGDYSTLPSVFETAVWFLDQLVVAGPVGSAADSAAAVLERHAVPCVPNAATGPFRCVYFVATPDGFELRRPTSCPHGPAPLGLCDEAPLAPEPVRAHLQPHVASCGCACSGLVRWTHRGHTPLPQASTEVAARTLSSLFGTGTADPWLCWDRFCDRADRDPRWLALWFELMANGEWSADAAAAVDVLCDTAFTTTELDQ